MDLYICNYKLGDVPLIAGVMTDSDVFTVATNYMSSTDLIELRVDMFDNLAIEHVEHIFRTAREKFKKPIIATVRDTKEGGQKWISDRSAIYKAVIPFADLIDIEINSEELFSEISSHCANLRKLLIGSYHNFQETPDDDFLEQIISKGKGLGADIIKIAAYAKNADDMIRLLVFTHKHKHDAVITMSVGDKGSPSRIVSPLFGSLFTYGYIRQPSAPGQLSVNELIYILRRLKMR